MSVSFKGGQKLKSIARTAERNDAVAYEVGFFPKAKYADGTPVAMVGLWQEFGTRNEDGSQRIPERPYFRNANKEASKLIRRQVLRLQDPVTKTLTKADAGKLAAFHAGLVQQSITKLRTPPLNQATVNRKGSSNPLIDTGLLRQSVSWEVLRSGS